MKKHRIGTIILIALVLLLIAAIGIYTIVKPWTTCGGQAGEQVFYAYNPDTGEVILYGEGDMWYFKDVGMSGLEIVCATSPFEDASPRIPVAISKVVISEGITTLSNEFLPESLEEIWIPSSVEWIGNFALSEQKALKHIYILGNAPEVGPPPFYTQIKDGEWLTRSYEPEGFAKMEAQFGATLFLAGAYYQDDPALDTEKVIHRQPGTAGWDAETWQSCTVVEEDFRLPLKYRLVAWYLETFCEAPEGVTGTLWGQFPETEG